MPVEIIGEFGTPGASREWISAILFSPFPLEDSNRIDFSVSAG